MLLSQLSVRVPVDNKTRRCVALAFRREIRLRVLWRFAVSVSAMDLLLEPWAVFPLLAERELHHTLRNEDKFQASMHLGHYRPEEVVVKVADNVVTVRAEHEERHADGYSHSRTVRQMSVPENTLVDQLTSHLTPDGDLLLETPYKEHQALPTTREIPITIEGAGDAPKKIENQNGKK